ncbi:piggyBac transposable element-derived protein 3-like [Sitophilus oryzae]|uniref:PiggyBac transposable element-derived protein 3-like n=1 Tax=Sitophilus oryzae TaxID=7048 RepID=A0A6J2XNU9_SITOR|nr:piggyBac transposable element-derived protein 3-like [Sitophilus oryzae]
MSDKRYWKKPLTLAELLEELESDSIPQVPKGIVIFPPENANDTCDTDEDSGDENDVVPNNLPGVQLRAQAEIDFEVESDNDWDSDDGLPLSNFIERRPKNSKTFAYTLNKDLENSFLEWQPIQNVKNNRSPGTTFKIFFDKDLVEEIVNFSNVYSQQKNRTGDITVDEMYCFLGVLLVSGYASVSRRHMYWQNCDDTQNKLISAAISRDGFQFIMSNLHCNNNTTLDKNDKYCKLRPLFNNLN